MDEVVYYSSVLSIVDRWSSVLSPVNSWSSVLSAVDSWLSFEYAISSTKNNSIIIAIHETDKTIKPSRLS